MSKRKYRAVWVKQVDVAGLSMKLGQGRVVVSVDVAKEDFFAAVMDEGEHVHEIVKWRHPEQSWSFIGLLEGLRNNGFSVEVAMEPSGTYGDAVRAQLWDLGFSVYRVSPKRCHDAAEVYDGVPSYHDAKSAAIIGKLHLDGASELWPLRPDEERALGAALRVLDIHAKEYQRNRNRLEGVLARHWPELPRILDLGSATLLELLIAFGGPSGVAVEPERARQLMRRVGGQFLVDDKIDQVVTGARATFGMPQIDEERRTVMVIAGEARRAQKAANQAKRRVEKLAQASPAAKEMSDVIGKTTAAVMVAAAGNPLEYESPRAYLKSVGLNLKEKSSGKKKGGLHITKRGPGVARLFLYLAVLRLIQTDPVVRAWYAKKVRRQGGKMKSKAVVAIMRKLVLALWHVARGNPFDSSRLFDTSRLDLQASVRAAS